MVGNPGNIEFYFLDSRLRGNDNKSFPLPGREELLHSAKVLRSF